MRIREVTHERVKNLGNYESVRIALTATVDDDDDPRDVMQALKLEAMVFLNIPVKKKAKS